jgi:alpha-ribazole phosphatase
MSSELSCELRVWRHPRPDGATGRCTGAGSDLPVHWRRAKRLARRVQRLVRRERLPHIVHCSPLRRSADVGRWLKRWGWRFRQDPALLELDFGGWEGRAWAAIARGEIDAWVADFANHRPGGGESLAQMLERVAAWSPPGEGGIVVGHGGWMLARRWLAEQGRVLPTAAQWPQPPRYGELWRF